MTIFSMDEKQKFMAGMAIAGILVLVMGDVAISDLQGRFRKNAQQMKLAEARLKKTLNMRQQRDIINADYARYELYLASGKMESRQIVEAFLREVERIARDAGVSVVNLSPQSIPENTQQEKEYKVDLKIECSHDQLMVFFNGIQNSRLLIRVDRFSTGTKDEQGLLLKVDLQLSLGAG